MVHKAILFDFDGTLVDTEWAIYQTWVRFYESEGQELPIETYVQCIGSDFDVWSPKTHLEALTGRSYDWERLDLVRNQQIRLDLVDQGEVQGVTDMLAALAATEDCRLAVVSSSSHEWVDGWLERLNLARFFELTVCRGDAPRIKPAPDLYLKAAEKLGLEPAECLVVEDSANGMFAAKEAGMTAYVIPNRITTVSDFTRADGCYQTLEALTLAIAEQFGCNLPALNQ